jgi:hypothetical protein
MQIQLINKSGWDGICLKDGSNSVPALGLAKEHILGFDYKISIEMIQSCLGTYGKVQLELLDDVFEDSEDSKETNALGVYAGIVKMNSDIPQLLPMDGRRVETN